jgi:hypothetical protein
MANVKTREVVVRDVFGVALVSKTATLKNNATGATVGTPVTTDGNGKASFANQNEALDYRVEVAVGGASGQVYVNGPSSPEVDHLYVNQSLRSRAGATVALGGPLTVAGGLTATGTLTAPLVSATTVSAGDLNVSGTAHIPTAYIDTLYVASYTTLTGFLQVDAAASFNGSVNVLGPGVDISGGPLTVQDDGNFFGVVRAEVGLIIGGGAVNWDNNGNLHHYSGIASFEGTGLVTGPDTPATFAGVLNAPARILVDGGTVALPDVACIADPDTGLWFQSGNAMGVVSNGGEIARFWMNGASSQVASYAAQTYIAGQIMLGSTTPASTMLSVVRTFAVRDGAGTLLGWVPLYGAFNP